MSSEQARYVRKVIGISPDGTRCDLQIERVVIAPEHGYSFDVYVRLPKLSPVKKRQR
jgi:hypothetical protein